MFNNCTPIGKGDFKWYTCAKESNKRGWKKFESLHRGLYVVSN